MRVFLDTTIAIDYLRGEEAALARIAGLFETGETAIVNDVVVCELATGAPSEDDAGLAAFLRAVEYVQPGPDVAVMAGHWRGDARRRGVTISAPDALIAACAAHQGATVVTRNARDFAGLPVRVETY
ncbi:MAG: type II toxin-antitoxin system VapC family toxin [Chloroflexi bacterium]|nr:type II toxin-antitoxin system VapC family toxin [Chloroflexota bacterium]